VEQFQQSFDTCKIVVSILEIFKSSLLYIEVWKRCCWLPAVKKSRLKLDQITNDLLLDLVIVLWRNNFKSIPCIEEYHCSHNCCSCTIADTKQSSEDSGCTIVLLSFSNVLQGISIQCLQIFLWISRCSRLLFFCNDRCDDNSI
jgi:hypothetical protein